jgi:hypothetical protein
MLLLLRWGQVPEMNISEAEYLPGVLGMLPFHEDREESLFVYGHLCTQLQSHLEQYDHQQKKTELKKEKKK